jgi:predicted DNA-binding protein with PD1-like motif
MLMEEGHVEAIKCRLTSEMIMVRLDPGERLLEGLREVIRAEGIRTGVVVSGIGSLSECRLHQVVAGYPPNLMTRHQEYLELKGSYEIASIQGIIADGEPHLHLTVCEGSHTVAGHLEDGCVVLGVAEVAILRAEDTPVRRVVRGPEKIKQLTANTA